MTLGPQNERNSGDTPETAPEESLGTKGAQGSLRKPPQRLKRSKNSELVVTASSCKQQKREADALQEPFLCVEPGLTPARGQAIAVAVVCNTRPMRDNLAALFQTVKGFACVGKHSRLETVLQKGALEKPDVVLINVGIPDERASRCVGELRVRFPRMESLVVLPTAEPRLVTGLLEAGAGGCLVQPVSLMKLLRAMVELRDHGGVLSSEIAGLLIQALRKRGTSHQLLEKLTGREREILECLSGGHPSKEIARRCGISVQTVNRHLAHIYGKLGVRSRTGAVSKFLGG